jgi:hypothetical protein
MEVSKPFVVLVATKAGIGEVVPDEVSPIVLLLVPLQIKEVPVPEFGDEAVKIIGLTFTPAQTEIFEIGVAIGIGLTVIVYVFRIPEHPFTVGVTVIVLDMGSKVELTAVKVGILAPVPEATKPIAVLLFVQLKVVPDGVPAKFIPGTVAPTQ